MVSKISNYRLLLLYVNDQWIFFFNFTINYDNFLSFSNIKIYLYDSKTKYLHWLAPGCKNRFILLLLLLATADLSLVINIFQNTDTNIILTTWNVFI